MAKKKYYKIIPIKHLLKNNVTAKAGEKIEGSAFVNLQDSLDRGFCKPVKDKSKNKNKSKNELDLSKKTVKQLDEFALENKIELSAEDKVNKSATVDAIKAALAKRKEGDKS